MKKKEVKPSKKYILIVLILLAMVLAFLIVKPFIIILLTSAILAYIFYPVYKWTAKKIRSKNSSALIITILILLLIIVPVSFLFYDVSKEVGVGYLRIQQYVNSGFASCEKGKVCDLIKQPQVKLQIKNVIEKITSYISDSANEFIFSIPRKLLDLVILFFSIFFFLRDGSEMLKGIRNLSIIKVKQEDKIINQLKEVVRSVIYGVFVIAVIEGIITVAVFHFGGLSSPLLWGFLVAVLAFIPFIGPTLVWVPALIIQILFQKPWSALLIVIGGIILSSLDFFVKPKMIGKRAKIHPIVIFIGLLGGLAFFGVIGIILGPLILALLISFIKMYKEDNK